MKSIKNKNTVIGFLFLQGKHRLFRAVKENNVQEVQKLLKKRRGGAVWWWKNAMRDANGDTVLDLACRASHEDMVRMLVEDQRSKGAPLQMSALREACLHGHERVVQILLSDDNVEDNSPLLWACKHANVMRLLLDRGVDPNGGTTPHTPLHSACCHGNQEIVSMLLQHHANPNAQDKDGFTPLHWVASMGHASLVALLLTHGANPQARDVLDKTPADYALDPQMESILRQTRESATTCSNHDKLELASVDTSTTTTSTTSSTLLEEDGSGPMVLHVRQDSYGLISLPPPRRAIL